MGTTIERATDLLHEWVQSDSLRKHCYAVAASMQHFARLQGADAEEWGAAGLLHDMDYERYPSMPAPGPETTAASNAILAGAAAEPPIVMHPFVGVTY
ncbi:HAD family hydrolase, partial [Kouleothrix aurantiaca]